jgi:hypothetical protein
MQQLLYDVGFHFPARWEFFRLQFDDPHQAKTHFETVEAYYASGGRRHRADDDAKALAAGFAAATRGGQ